MFDVYLFWPQSIPPGYDTLIEMCIHKWDSKNQRFEYEPHVVDFLVGLSALCNILAIEFFVIFNPEIYSKILTCNIWFIFNGMLNSALAKSFFFLQKPRLVLSVTVFSLLNFMMVFQKKFSILWCDNYCPIEATKLDSSEKKEIIFIIQ